MNNEENIELLDLDDNASLDVLPDAAPLVSPRPRRPWLLLGLGVIVIVLATYIIIRTINGDSSSSMQVDLDGPVVVAPVPDTMAPGGVTPPPPAPHPTPAPDMIVVPVIPTPAPAPAPAAATAGAAPAPSAGTPAAPNTGSPVRVIEDRRSDVRFNPDAPATKPAAKPASKPIAKPATKPAARPAQKPAKSVAVGGWYVQFGSYGTREAADAAGRRIRAEHPSLFAGHQFVVLAAQVQGTTKYRLRVAFSDSNDANAFCRNAKSDGLDCYVAK